MLCLLLFFFVNQKTAYEMRISDWSSDVCSSDLLVPLLKRSFPALDFAPEAATADPELLAGSFAAHLPLGDLPAGPPPGQAFLQEIGRASCRERVCPYV